MKPKDIKIGDARKEPLPPLPIPMGSSAYPAVCHAVTAAKGRIHDDGWWIKWYDSAEEASRIDAEARTEARSYERSREIKAEFESAPTIQFPFGVPDEYQEELLDPQYIMSLTGLKPDSYVIEEETRYWYFPEYSGSWDRDTYEYEAGESSSASFVQKKDCMIQIGKNGFKHLFESTRLFGEKNYQSAWASPLLRALVLSEEKISEIKNILEEREEKRKAEYDSQVEIVREEIRRSKEFSFLPQDLQNRVLGGSYTQLHTLKEELKKEWPKAVQISKMELVLVNWGGHFRRMGAANNEDYFVVSYDGLIREPDHIEYRKAYFQEGDKMWDVVGEREVALYWSQYDIDLEVIKEPLEYTDAQFEAIGKIREMLGIVID